MFNDVGGHARGGNRRGDRRVHRAGSQKGESCHCSASPFLAEFAFCGILYLLLTLLCERAVGYLQIEDVVKILGNSRECLVAEASSALEVPSAVLLVERHVEPLNFECVVGRGHVPGRKGFG